MIFNKHFELEGKHAFLGASKYHWINYSDDKLSETYMRQLATQRGTELHELAAKLIKMGIKLPRTKQTLNMYVNDAIAFRMSPEVVLKYSNNAFGTADGLSFKSKVLRVHDLKTGVTPAHMQQLFIYVALFCLEYKMKPGELEDIICRLYQNDEVIEAHPTVEDIVPIMDKIIRFDKRISMLIEEGA